MRTLTALLLLLVAPSLFAGVTKRPVTGLSKSGSTVLKGDVTITGGTNVTITQSGQDISIAAAGSSGLPVSSLSTKTADYTLLATDDVIVVNSSSAVTITVLTAVGNSGKRFEIKNSNTGFVTINTTSSQTIDGELTQTLTIQYSSITIVSDGSNWHVL